MKILIACVGNIFLGDDGFGVEVARRLASRSLPPDVTVRDFGIRGFDLAYALMGSQELTILVDACAHGFAPGTVFVLEPDPIEDPPKGIELHGINPLNALRMVKSLGGTPGRVLIVGCEPAAHGSDYDDELGLSDIVAAAVDKGVNVIETLVSKVLEGEPVI